MEIEIRTAPYPHQNSFAGRDLLERAHLHNRWFVPLWKYKIIKFLANPK